MVSEFDLIARFFNRRTQHTELGIGDDAALIRPSPDCELVISTDMLVEGTHFFSDADPESLGWKCLAVNLSDIAAMGGTPRWATLACTLWAPPSRSVSPAPTGEMACAPSATTHWLAEFSRGFFLCAERYGIDLIGGDTTRGPAGATTFNITIIGEVPQGQAIRRDAARLGDLVWVSGSPGRAGLGLAHLQGRGRLEETELSKCLIALHRPTPRVELGLALRGVASAAIDVSDGLLADLGHILRASGVGASLTFPDLPEASLAREMVLAGGDDYELIFCAGAKDAATIVALGERLGIALCQIGVVDSKRAGVVSVLDSNGADITPRRLGFDHFDR